MKECRSTQRGLIPIEYMPGRLSDYLVNLLVQARGVKSFEKFLQI